MYKEGCGPALAQVSRLLLWNYPNHRRAQWRCWKCKLAQAQSRVRGDDRAPDLGALRHSALVDSPAPVLDATLVFGESAPEPLVVP